MLGFCSICAQAVFIRELLALFSGTEFTIGILFSSWLFWTGLGGFFGGSIARSGGIRREGIFRTLSAIAAVLLPLTVILIRTGRGLLADPPGELPSYGEALFFSMGVSAPFCLAYGMIYSAAARALRGDGIRSDVTRVYSLEAAGSVTGALIFSLVLIRYFSQFESVILVSSFLLIATLIPQTSKKGYLIVSALALLLVFIFSRADDVDRHSMERIFPGYRVIASVSSKYGELVAAGRGETVSYFSGGERIISIPEPERSEESVHIPLLIHPDPRRVLLVGGAVGGGSDEALKHSSIRRLDCLELDKRLLDLVGSTSPGEGVRPERLLDEEPEEIVNFIQMDGRTFMTRCREKYDVIIVNTPSPVNLQWNRFYTTQFFRLAAEMLEENGIFAISHDSSENFIAGRQADILKILYSTMGAEFDSLSLVPGSRVHFLAGRKKPDQRDILQNLKARSIKNLFVSENYLPARLDPQRIEMLESVAGDRGSLPLNTDMSPILPFYEMILEGWKKGYAGQQLLERATHYPRTLIPASIALIIIVLAAVTKKRSAPICAVFITGFAGFLFQMMIMIFFQSVSGHLYHEIIMISALFMAGASAGGRNRLVDGRRRGEALRLHHLLYIAAILTFAAVGWSIGRNILQGWHVLAVFYLYSFLNGLITGSYYRSAVRSVSPGRIRRSPALIYASDLFGACAGSLLGGSLIISLSGISWSLVLLLVIHVAGASILARKI